jgi:hypothetical protein
LKEEFYDECSKILKIEHSFKQYYKRTRWNKRNKGNGRFPGFGLIRCHGDNCFIVVSKHGTKTLNTKESVFSYLRGLNDVL